MDTDPILTRLHKLDDHLTKLRARAGLSEYEHLTHRLNDFEAFARAILEFMEEG